MLREEYEKTHKIRLIFYSPQAEYEESSIYLDRMNLFEKANRLLCHYMNVRVSKNLNPILYSKKGNFINIKLLDGSLHDVDVNNPRENQSVIQGSFCHVELSYTDVEDEVVYISMRWGEPLQLKKNKKFTNDMNFYKVFELTINDESHNKLVKKVQELYVEKINFNYYGVVKHVLPISIFDSCFENGNNFFCSELITELLCDVGVFQKYLNNLSEYNLGVLSNIIDHRADEISIYVNDELKKHFEIIRGHIYVQPNIVTPNLLYAMICIKLKFNLDGIEINNDGLVGDNVFKIISCFI